MILTLHSESELIAQLIVIAVAPMAVRRRPVTNAASDPDEVARLKAELPVARVELTGARLIIEQPKAQLAVLRRVSFGRLSEKLTAEITQLEVLLNDLKEGEAERIAPVAVSASDERERRHPVPPLPSHLPREEILHHPGDACPGCGSTSLSKFGDHRARRRRYRPGDVVRLGRPRRQVAGTRC